MVLVLLLLLVLNDIEAVVDKLLLLEELISILGSAQQVYEVYRMHQGPIGVQSQGDIDIYPLYLIILLFLVVYYKVVYLSLYNSESIRSIKVLLVLFADLFNGQSESGVVLAVEGSLGPNITKYMLSYSV